MTWGNSTVVSFLGESLHFSFISVLVIWLECRFVVFESWTTLFQQEHKFIFFWVFWSEHLNKALLIAYLSQCDRLQAIWKTTEHVADLIDHNTKDYRPCDKLKSTMWSTTDHSIKDYWPYDNPKITMWPTRQSMKDYRPCDKLKTTCDSLQTQYERLQTIQQAKNHHVTDYRPYDKSKTTTWSTTDHSMKYYRQYDKLKTTMWLTTDYIMEDYRPYDTTMS